MRTLAQTLSQIMFQLSFSAVLASKLPICLIFGSAMSGNEELIAILSEEIMSYAFKNKAISKQLLRVVLALRGDFRE